MYLDILPLDPQSIEYKLSHLNVFFWGGADSDGDSDGDGNDDSDANDGGIGGGDDSADSNDESEATTSGGGGDPGVDSAESGNNSAGGQGGGENAGGTGFGGGYGSDAVGLDADFVGMNTELSAAVEEAIGALEAAGLDVNTANIGATVGGANAMEAAAGVSGLSALAAGFQSTVVAGLNAIGITGVADKVAALSTTQFGFGIAGAVLGGVTAGAKGAVVFGKAGVTIGGMVSSLMDSIDLDFASNPAAAQAIEEAFESSVDEEFGEGNYAEAFSDSSYRLKNEFIDMGVLPIDTNEQPAMVEQNRSYGFELQGLMDRYGLESPSSPTMIDKPVYINPTTGEVSDPSLMGTREWDLKSKNVLDGNTDGLGNNVYTNYSDYQDAISTYNTDATSRNSDVAARRNKLSNGSMYDTPISNNPLYNKYFNQTVDTTNNQQPPPRPRVQMLPADGDVRRPTVNSPMPAPRPTVFFEQDRARSLPEPPPQSGRNSYGYIQPDFSIAPGGHVFPVGKGPNIQSPQNFANGGPVRKMASGGAVQTPAWDALMKKYVYPDKSGEVADAEAAYRRQLDMLKQSNLSRFNAPASSPSRQEKSLAIASAFADPGDHGSFWGGLSRATGSLGDMAKEERLSNAKQLHQKYLAQQENAQLDTLDARGRLSRVQSQQDASTKGRQGMAKTLLDKQFGMGNSSSTSAIAKMLSEMGFVKGTPEYVAKFNELLKMKHPGKTPPTTKRSPGHYVATDLGFKQGTKEYDEIVNQYSFKATKAGAELNPDGSLDINGLHFDKNQLINMAESYSKTGKMPAMGMKAGPIRQAIMFYHTQGAVEKGKTGQDVAVDWMIGDAQKKTIAKQRQNIDMASSFIENMGKQYTQWKEIAKKIKRTDIRALNYPINLWDKKVVGNPDLMAYEMLITELSNEMTRLAVSNPASIAELSQSAREKWENIHDLNLSVSDMTSLLGETIKAANNRFESMNNVYVQTVRGAAGEDSTTGRPYKPPGLYVVGDEYEGKKIIRKGKDNGKTVLMLEGDTEPTYPGE